MKDSDFYRLSRKKGDPRDFIPYPALFQQWKSRRAECREWRKVSEQAALDREARAQAERERAQALAVLEAAGINPAPALVLAAELDKVRAELERERVRANHWQDKAERLEAGRPDPFEERRRALYARFEHMGGPIPADQWRRLLQLAHPDKHAGSEAAETATRWLLENRP